MVSASMYIMGSTLKEIDSYEIIIYNIIITQVYMVCCVYT